MPKPFVINDETKTDLLFPSNKSTGLDISALSKAREGGRRAYAGVAEQVPEEWLIPETDWQGIIEEQKQRKIRIIDVADRMGVKRKDQKRLNYCWVFSPTYLQELIRAKMNLPYISLSPASAGSIITKFKNVGGWGRTSVEFLAKNGVAPSDLWPDTEIDPKYKTDSTLLRMKSFRITEWFELRPRNLKEVISLLLRGYPITAGYNWWGHQVTLTYVDWIDGRACPGLDNSWGYEWGDAGRGVLQGARALPDDALAPRDVLPTFA